MAEAFVAVGGQWKKVTDTFVSSGGQYKQVSNAVVSVGGAYKTAWDAAPVVKQFTVIGDTAGYWWSRNDYTVEVEGTWDGLRLLYRVGYAPDTFTTQEQWAAVEPGSQDWQIVASTGASTTSPQTWLVTGEHQGLKPLQSGYYTLLYQDSAGKWHPLEYVQITQAAVQPVTEGEFTVAVRTSNRVRVEWPYREDVDYWETRDNYAPNSWTHDGDKTYWDRSNLKSSTTYQFQTRPFFKGVAGEWSPWYSFSTTAPSYSRGQFVIVKSPATNCHQSGIAGITSRLWQDNTRTYWYAGNWNAPKSVTGSDPSYRGHQQTVVWPSVWTPAFKSVQDALVKGGRIVSAQVRINRHNSGWSGGCKAALGVHRTVIAGTSIPQAYATWVPDRVIKWGEDVWISFPVAWANDIFSQGNSDGQTGLIIGAIGHPAYYMSLYKGGTGDISVVVE